MRPQRWWGLQLQQASRDGSLPECYRLRPGFRTFSRFGFVGIVLVFWCGHGYASDPAVVNWLRSTLRNLASLPLELIFRRMAAYSGASGVLPPGLVHNSWADIASTIAWQFIGSFIFSRTCNAAAIWLTFLMAGSDVAFFFRASSYVRWLSFCGMVILHT